MCSIVSFDVSFDAGVHHQHLTGFISVDPLEPYLLEHTPFSEPQRSLHCSAAQCRSFAPARVHVTF